jgi:acyl carrier protein
MLREILQLPTHGRNTFRSVRLFASGGDSLSAADVAAFAKAFPDARLENAYGTTEAGSAIRGDPRVDAALVSIGRPVGKTVAFVVNDGLQKCACGEPGELAIGGPGIARGYVEDAALTADRFRPDPFSGHPGARLYLTGDKCRALPDGRFVHLGRLDRQTMINGARVEPAEVEATIGASGTVRDVVVVPRMLASRPRLVAYVVPRERWDDGPRELLHQRLVATLPSYMRPALIVALSAMPYRANGKPDLTRLPWPVKSSDCIDNGNDREGGGILAIVVEEVQNVLDIARVEVSANFFENGGDSISAVRLSNAFEARLGIRESIDGILESGSIRALSDRVEQKIGARRRVGEIEDGSPPEGQLDSPASGATAGEQTGDNDVLSMQEEGLLRGELRYWGGVQPQGQSQVRLGLEFRGRIELTHLETCINTVIAWHDLLMTAYTPTYQNGAWIKRGWREVGILISQDPQLAGDVRFVKEVRRHRRLTLPLIEVIGDAGEGRSTIHRVTQSLIGARFNYSNPPLVLVCAIRASPSQANLIIIMPHIVSDGWSIRRFAEQVMRLYDGGVLEGRLEPNRRATYVDFARHQRLHAAATMRAVRAGAFDSERCDALQIQAIVEGSGRTFGGNHNTKRLRVISLSPSVANSMRELTTRERVTPFMCVVAAFAVVLGRRSRRGRVGVRTVHANRIKAEYEDVIGFFASGQIICVDLSRSPSLAAICKRVRKEVSSVMSRGAVVLANPFGDTNDPHYGVEVRMDDRPLRIWGQECNARSFRVAPGDDGECALRLVVRDESLTTLALEYCPGCIRGSDVMEISEDIGRVMDSDVNTPIHGLCCEP